MDALTGSQAEYALLNDHDGFRDSIAIENAQFTAISVPSPIGYWSAHNDSMRWPIYERRPRLITRIICKLLFELTVPPPTFDHSQERENLVRKLKLMNKQNTIFYIYCVGMSGQIITTGMVQGKVSSLNSLLTTPEQIVGYRDGTGTYRHEKMPSPDFDGSYGKNPEGVFWFDPQGGYHEWSGWYYLSDRPEHVSAPVSITANVELEKK